MIDDGRPSAERSSGSVDWTDDAERHLDGTAQLAKVVSRRLTGDVEVYARSSRTVRVHREAGASRCSTLVGRDDGLAVRAWIGDGLGFAATTGFDEAGAGRLVEALLAAPAGPAPGPPTWETADGCRTDRDAEAALPAIEAAERWLESATARIEPWSEAWVEVAVTIESRVAAGAGTSRVRGRAWAVALPDKGGRSPLVTAARCWDRLPEGGWARLDADRIQPGETDPGAEVPRSGCVLVGPEAAAVLVRALVLDLHADPGQIGLEVGPGWSVTDAADSAAGLLGGSFDDAGFPTRPTRLAGDGRVQAVLAGPGSYRRASFRDRPAPHPAHLIVDPAPVAPPARGLLVTGLRVQPLDPTRWVLEVEGALLADGVPAARIASGHLLASPLELAHACAGAVGDARDSHLGVRTPALLFEKLSRA